MWRQGGGKYCLGVFRPELCYQRGMVQSQSHLGVRHHITLHDASAYLLLRPNLSVQLTISPSVTSSPGMSPVRQFAKSFAEKPLLYYHIAPSRII
jgi:hypothetical protein